MMPYMLALLGMASVVPSPDAARAAALEFSCTIHGAYRPARSGALESESGWTGKQFSVSRETGKIMAAALGSVFAGSSSKQVVLFGGGHGEPFTLLSLDRKAEGRLSVEFLAVEDSPERAQSAFVAFGVSGVVFSGICD